MRLLNTTTFDIQSGEQSIFRQEGYAILSHRWVGLEITFEQLKNHVTELRTGTIPLTPQLDKIRGACQTARDQGIQWMWIDNCCIDKRDQVELTESLNSMFKWYRDAKVCITYMSDVMNGAFELSTPNAMFKNVESGHPSVWFSRGWTLQELLAPKEMQFYDADWNYFGTKTGLAKELEEITGIRASYLTGTENFAQASIATKMSWMAGRETGKVEDIAYSMLGIFNVTMTPQYGEGIGAFMRLQETLLSKSSDESIFAWRMPQPGAGRPYTLDSTGWESDEWGLLAPSPKWFQGCGNIDVAEYTLRPGGGFSRTQKGVLVEIPGLEARVRDVVALSTIVGAIPMAIHWRRKEMKPFMFQLNCYVRDNSGNQKAIRIYLQPLSRPPARTATRIRCHELFTDKPRAENKYGQQATIMQPEPGYND